jgi:hypothetical protein
LYDFIDKVRGKQSHLIFGVDRRPRKSSLRKTKTNERETENKALGDTTYVVFR